MKLAGMFTAAAAFRSEIKIKPKGEARLL